MNSIKGVSRLGVHLQVVPTNASDFKSNAVFDVLERNMKAKGKEWTHKIKGIYHFTALSGEHEGKWLVDFFSGPGSISYNPPHNPKYLDANEKPHHVYITMQDEDLLKMLTWQLEPQEAYRQGKLKIRGNIGFAMKLRELSPVTGKTKL